MKLEIVNITPEMARQWLRTNIHNRVVSAALVCKYATDIVNGRWLLTHQGLAFDTKGILRDGQHRLLAVAYTEIAARMVVAFDVPEEAFIAVDTGTARSYQDTMTIAGTPLPKMYLPILNGILYGEGMHNYPVGHQTKTVYIAAYHDAIRFTLDCFNAVEAPSGFKVMHVMGVIARAYFTQDRDKLKEFCNLYLKGFDSNGPTDANNPAIKFRNWKENHPDHKANEVYRKAQRAVGAFLKGDKLPKLYDQTDELFEIPKVDAKIVKDIRHDLNKLKSLFTDFGVVSQEEISPKKARMLDEIYARK